MSSEQVAALIGLVGVLVGTGIGVFASNLRPGVRTLRGVARLLHAGLEAAGERRDVEFPSEFWDEHRLFLAGELGPWDWSTLLKGYQAAFKLYEARSADTPMRSDAEADAVEERLRALDVLEGLSGAWPLITQARRRRRRLDATTDSMAEEQNTQAD